MKLIDIDKVKAEIEEQIRKNECSLDDNLKEYALAQKTGACSVLNDILHFLDTLPEEKQEDLQKEIEEIWEHDKVMNPDSYDKGFEVQLDKNNLSHLASHFYNLGLSSKQVPTSTDLEEAKREQDFCNKILLEEHRQPTYSDAIEYGINWQKQQQENCPKIKGWVARDKDGRVFLYKEKPTKYIAMAQWTGKFITYANLKDFPEVTWKDEEPTEIELTIKKL